MRILFLCLICTLLLACSSLDPVPADTFYRFKNISQFVSKEKLTAWTKATLQVERLRAAGIYKDRAIVLMQPDGVSLRQSKYHYWNDSPEIMLQQRILAHARGYGLASIITGDNASVADIVIGGHVLRFERILEDAGNSSAVAIELELNVRTAEGDTVVQDLFKFEQTLSSTETAAAIEAISDGVDKLIEQFLLRADRALASRIIKE